MRERIEDRSYYDMIADDGFTVISAALGYDMVDGVAQIPTVFQRDEDGTFWIGHRLDTDNTLKIKFVQRFNEAPQDWYRVVPTKDGSQWTLATEEPPTG